MRNAKAKGKRIGRPPRTWLSEETRKDIALAYKRGEGSFTPIGRSVQHVGGDCAALCCQLSRHPGKSFSSCLIAAGELWLASRCGKILDLRSSWSEGTSVLPVPLLNQNHEGWEPGRMLQ